MSEDSRFNRFREWMNEGAGKWVFGLGGAAAVLVAMTVFLSGSDNDRADDIRGRGLLAQYLCTQCGNSDKLRVVFGAGEPVDFASKFPVDCPKCAAAGAAVLAFNCNGCGKPMAQPAKPLFKCPHCQRVYDNRMPPE